MGLKKVIVLLCLGMLFIVGITATAQSAVLLPTTLTQTAIAECHVYPWTFEAFFLEGKSPMPNPFADPRTIPENSILTVTADPGTNRFPYVSWTGLGSNSELEMEFDYAGYLGHGFNEAVPPSDDVIALNQLNHRLEIGDWVTATYGSLFEFQSYWEWHINNHSMLIVPIHELFINPGSSPSYRVSRFVTLRLLSYDMSSSNRHFRFGLVDLDSTYTCFNYNDTTNVGVENIFTPIMPFDPYDPRLLWNFGDNTTSTAITATHSYAQPGLYTVRLFHAETLVVYAEDQILVNPSPPTVTPSATFTPDPSHTPTLTPEPSHTPTLTPTLTFTPEPSHTPTLTPEPSHTPTLTPEPTVVPRWTIWIPSLRQDQ